MGLSFSTNTHAETTELMAGDVINTSEFLCTVSFHATVNDTPDYIVTAGHCLDDSQPFWKFGGTYIGTSTQTRNFNWSGLDMGLIHSNGNSIISNKVRLSDNNETIELISYQESIKDAHRGDKVCMKGAMSGYKCGKIKFKIPFTSYIWTDIKPLEGDSGGPIFMDLGDGKGELVGVLSGHILGDMYFGHTSKIFELDSGIKPYLGDS